MSQENEIEEKERAETTDFLPSDGASCSAWVSVDTPPEKDGWYLVWVMPGDETDGYIPGFEQAYWTGKIEDWEPADSCGPLSDGCYVSHWAEVYSPNS